ncbi:MAG TPA: vWA domain-containing protein [Gammaproteobacteria bacterium]|nr:vWA domain-containing protein [Gammaproteobacteria bacterium]
MKTKILVLALVLATVTTVAIYPTLRGNATGVTPPKPPVTPTQIVPLAQSGKIDVVFVLDTTGSMGGLIQAAKEKIWSVASTLAQAKQSPEIRMGLVAYRDRGDAYVTQVVDLSNDLDTMYSTLMRFNADGGGDGPESVNKGLFDAVYKMSWSEDPQAYKVVFLVGDAPPHMDYQDDVKYPEVVAAAVQKGIVVNTIQCGRASDTVTPWQQIASLGHGRYFTVDQAGGAVAIATPFDGELAKLAAELDSTRLYYGTERERATMDRKVAATSELHEAASPAAQARRAAFNASASGAANLLGDKDLVNDVATGRVDLAAVPAVELPASIAALPPEQQAQELKERSEKREKLQHQINELAGERDEFIAAKVKEQGGAEGSLDVQIYDAVREQGKAAGLSYEGGPKF